MEAVVVRLSDFRKTPCKALVPIGLTALPSIRMEACAANYAVEITLQPSCRLFGGEEFEFLATDSGVVLRVECHGRDNAKALIGIFRGNARARQLSFTTLNFTGIPGEELGL
jgi:hypothetical protein